MKRLSNYFHKEKYKLFLFVLLLALLYSCKTIENDQPNAATYNKYYTVIKVKKLSGKVYIVYASRNDTVFKIASYYSGNKRNNERKLGRGDHFYAHLYSQFKSIEERFNMISTCNEFIEFHGVTIGKEPELGVYDVWFCNELNGPYIKQ